MIGTLVECLNCGLIWQRILADSNPGGTVLLQDIQVFCPRCCSNAYKRAPVGTGRGGSS